MENEKAVLMKDRLPEKGNKPAACGNSQATVSVTGMLPFVACE